MSPQEAWNQTIQVAAAQASSSLKSYVDQLSMLENVPRKEKQFRNFTVNSLRLKGPNGEKVKGEIWSLLVKVREEEKKKKDEFCQQKQHTKPTSKKEDENLGSSKTVNSKHVSDSDDESLSNNNGKRKAIEFPPEKAVTKAMKKALKKSPNKQLKFKTLRKQVQESLSFKVGKEKKKRWTRMLQQCVNANPKKLVMNGKMVTLTK
mmetsp:Transcript_44183/g.94063  ORF Transcript_44183/g.94063 Transcript_44183/m.94063 type:complete len:205 (-) Transcript_44183:119-733(-)